MLCPGISLKKKALFPEGERAGRGCITPDNLSSGISPLPVIASHTSEGGSGRMVCFHVAEMWIDVIV